MVLINGVKYACERCIRGHRVTTCIHTDQPLTMIKPKGRPASQCLHCREQRKMKNVHISCTCNKKGKSPGTHLALCQCNKNTHCTCACVSSKKLEKSKKKTLRNHSDSEAALFSTPNDDGLGVNLPNHDDSLNSNYVFEDMAENLDTNSGLFDLFSNQNDQFIPAQQINLLQFLDVPNSASSSPVPSSSSNAALSSATPQELQHTIKANTTPAKEGRRVAGEELMFPLFPLVGSCSFDDSESRPLLTLPGTHHPKPIVPNSGHQHSAARPKRPESVLSVASNSSTATNQSRLNVQLESYFNGHSGPIQSNSAAYPPSLPESASEGGPHGPEPSDRMFEEAEFFDQNPFNETHELRLNEYQKFIGAINSQPGPRNGYMENQLASMPQPHNYSPINEPGAGSAPLAVNVPDPQEQYNIDFGGGHMFNDLVSPIKFETKDVNL